eukprot:833839-Pleurochrysis_carterae.AAC.1
MKAKKVTVPASRAHATQTPADKAATTKRKTATPALHPPVSSTLDEKATTATRKDPAAFGETATPIAKAAVTPTEPI